MRDEVLGPGLSWHEMMHGWLEKEAAAGEDIVLRMGSDLAKVRRIAFGARRKE